MLTSLITLFFGILVGILNVWMGLKGRKHKIYRELHGDYRELPGPFEGALEKGWLMFVIVGVFCILFAIINFINDGSL